MQRAVVVLLCRRAKNLESRRRHRQWGLQKKTELEDLQLGVVV